MKYLCILAAFSLGLIFGNSGTATGAAVQTIVARIDAETAAEYEKDKVGSVTVGVVSKGVLVWVKSYGAADMERGITATPDTIYRIGSVTKQFTALMLLQLVETGKVRLSDPVKKYFPEVKAVQNRYKDAAAITLVQLATHTSGLDREPDEPEPYWMGPVSEWENILISALPHTKFAYEPGTQFSYSNIGYAILGAALSRAAHQSFVSYIQQHVLDPLDMKDTYFEPNDLMKSRIAKGYLIEKDSVDTSITEAQHVGRGYRVPNGALYTTVGDMAKFVAYEMGSASDAVLRKDAIDANWKRIVISDADWTEAYGIGFMVKRVGNSVVYGHSGSAAAYQTQAFFSRKTGIGLIIMSSSRGGKFDPANILTKAFDEN